MARSPYLSQQEIEELHALVIGRLGGMRGVRDNAALESCVAQPKTAVFGVERFPTAFDKAAAYCFFLVRLHPFYDGNKRTGVLAAQTFLLDSGYGPFLDEDEMYELIISVTKGEAEVEALASAFRKMSAQDSREEP